MSDKDKTPSNQIQGEGNYDAGRKFDAEERAFVQSGQVEDKADSRPEDEGKDPAAVSLGRRGGLKGGKARAEKLTPEQRAEIARKAAEARWRTRQE